MQNSAANLIDDAHHGVARFVGHFGGKRAESVAILYVRLANTAGQHFDPDLPGCGFAQIALLDAQVLRRAPFHDDDVFVLHGVSCGCKTRLIPYNLINLRSAVCGSHHMTVLLAATGQLTEQI